MVLAGMGFPLQPQDLTPIDCDSVWTIDLCYILKNYCQDFTMYTTYIGVNWEHSNSTFYAKEYRQDMKRVHDLFAKAKANFIRIVTTRLSMLDICRFMLSNRYAIIALVNGNILSCHLCTEKKRKQWWRDLCCAPKKKREFGDALVAPILIPSANTHYKTPNASPSSNNPNQRLLVSPKSRIVSTPVSRRLSFQSNSSPAAKPIIPPQNSPSSSSLSSFMPLLPPNPDYSYGSTTQIPTDQTIYNLLGQEFAGHYIVLIGYDKENDMFLYRDPGTDSELCVVSFDNLEESMSKETDNDLIVVRVL